MGVSVLTPVANAQPIPGSDLNGPHPGAPLGGSSMTRDDSGFFENTADLSGFKPGEVIAKRHLPYHALGLSAPVDVVQIKFRTTDAQGNPTFGITSVVKPLVKQNGNLVSFHSVYDSLDPAHSPSRAIQGDVALGTVVASAESALLLDSLAQGTTVAVTDIEGQNANFAAGPEYGTTTLDGIRASLAEPDTGLGDNAKVGMMGYSGGAIASNWAAQMAPEYAPEINDKIVGVATGGLLVNPLHNLEYANGSMNWAGVVPMTVIGLARAYNLDFDKYLSDYGRSMFQKLAHASISEITGSYGGVTWASLVKPEYRDPASIPELVDVVKKTNLGEAPMPTVPFFFGEANNGVIDGTMPHKQWGTGDGIMVTGDVQDLANKYCQAGVPVHYEEYPFLPHTVAFTRWFPGVSQWMKDRFAGRPAPSSCGSIPAGNDISTPNVVPPAPAGAPQELPQGSAGARNLLGS